MMRAITRACEPSGTNMWLNSKRSDGLRAIRALEKRSGRPFDPFDKVLINIVTGQAGNIEYHRRTAGTNGRIAALAIEPEAEVIPIEQGRRPKRRA